MDAGPLRACRTRSGGVRLGRFRLWPSKTVRTNSHLMHFEGATFDVAEDSDRLSRQLDAVRRLMGDGQWRTLAEVALEAGYTVAAVASVSARLRDLRKARWGRHVVERRRRCAGLWEYRFSIGSDPVSPGASGMTSAEACTLLTDTIRTVSKVTAERDSWRLVASAMTSTRRGCAANWRWSIREATSAGPGRKMSGTCFSTKATCAVRTRIVRGVPLSRRGVKYR